MAERRRAAAADGAAPGTATATSPSMPQREPAAGQPRGERAPAANRPVGERLAASEHNPVPAPERKRLRRRAHDHEREHAPDPAAPWPAAQPAREPERDGLAFGPAVHALRLAAGLSLNQLARDAGVDPAYVHRIESRALERPPQPRRAVVLSIAAALGLDGRRTDELLAHAGYAPHALLALGGWDEALATIADLLADPALSGPAKAEFREMLRMLAHRWGRSPPGRS
jgi:transcriptional regulator with XRE-family HTH domain